MLDEACRANHEDLVALYETLIDDIKGQRILSSKFNQELDIRRILESLISDDRTRAFLEDHMKLRVSIAQLDHELKALVHISEKGLSRKDWWNYSFI